MPAGILVQHRRSAPSTSELVRGDVLALIGVIPRERWPAGLGRGDVVHEPFSNGTEGPGGPLPAPLPVDPVTRAAAEAFLANGGRHGHLVLVCLDRPASLAAADVCSTGVLAAALEHLQGLDSVGLLAMPVLAWLAGPDSLGTWAGLLEHCERFGARFLLVDPPQDTVGDSVIEWGRELAERAGSAASFGALYHPWLQLGDGRVPPSGSVAGLYARIEEQHAPFGFRWPPANEELVGVTHPTVEVRGAELDALVEGHVNPVVTMPGRGVVVWGARTLSRDARYRFVNTRRIVSGVAEQLRRDSEWAVFEDHRPALWEILARNVRARLDLLYGAGVLAGASSREAYRVQCDEELNPPVVRDAGELHVRVEIQPVSTTELIVIDLQLGA